MRHVRGHAIEVETLDELRARLGAGTDRLSGWQLRGLDLTGHPGLLAGVDPAGALFLGCALTDADEQELRSRGALVFPALPGIPVDPYRAGLYAPAELYDCATYAETLDARAYAWSRADPDPDLARALHDHAIDDALDGWVRGRHLVGVMGGHSLERGTPGYAEAARLGHLVGAELVVATGGGPGAMEAANLGARLARRPTADLDAALEVLARVPSYRPSVEEWVGAAFEVLEQCPDPHDTLGIPTWHYGHEPPNPFGTAIAKYFRNATREAILLEICERGIVFLPGAAGTVQEVFQDACENYYADESATAPMVLVGREHWTRTVPAWPLLTALAAGRPMERSIHLVETVEEAAAVVLAPR